MLEKFENKYTIKSTRLSGYDYSQNGMYFVTICTKNREELLGEITDGKMRLSQIGKIAEECWKEIPNHFPFVILDEFVVMPNHIHGIIGICKNDIDIPMRRDAKFCVSTRATQYKNKFGSQSKNLASIIRGFKVGVKKYATINDVNFAWQPRFYDHIIRNDESLQKIREYIKINPKMWQRDRNNMENVFI